MTSAINFYSVQNRLNQFDFSKDNCEEKIVEFKEAETLTA